MTTFSNIAMRKSIKKSIFFVGFTFLLFCIGIPNLRAVSTRCSYVWKVDDKSYVQILETNDDSRQLTVINSRLEFKFARVNKDGIPLNSDGSCPTIAFYRGNTGLYIYKGRDTCVKDKKNNEKYCSSDITGKLEDSNQSSGDLTGMKQFKITSSTSDECEYTSIMETETVHGISYEITLKSKKNKKVGGTCSDFGSNCHVTVDSDIQNRFYNGNTFICPTYIYTKTDSNGADTIIYEVVDTGTNADEDRSNVDTSLDHAYDRLDEPEEIKDVDKLTNACKIINKDSGFFKILKRIVGYIQIGTIFLVLILGVLDLTGAVGSDKDDALKKAVSKFGKRMIAAALIFLVPAMLNIIFNVINISSCGVDDDDLISELFK